MIRRGSRAYTIIALHLLLLVYSFGGVFSKIAAGASFPSMLFFVCYGLVLSILGIYAIGWQQIIKRMPLTTAFANKAVGVVWGIAWGMVFFGDSLTIGKLVGALLVVAGVILMGILDGEDRADEKDELLLGADDE